MIRRQLSNVSRRTRAAVVLATFVLVSGFGLHVPAASADESACKVVQISLICDPGQPEVGKQDPTVKPTTTISGHADTNDEAADDDAAVASDDAAKS